MPDQTHLRSLATRTLTRCKQPDRISSNGSLNMLSMILPSYSVDMGQDASSLFAEQIYPDAQSSAHDAWSVPTSPDSNAQVNGTHGPYVQQQSWYSDVRSTGYEPRSNHNAQPAVRNAFMSDHDPYKPSHQGHHQSPAPSAPSYDQTQLPYDPYKPSTTTAYAPIVSRPQATRETYKPISRSVSSPYAPSSVAPSLAPPPQPTTVGDTPPAATTAASYRPKVLNAYDPPLPPPRATKRAASMRTPRSASPAVGHQMHGQMSAPPVPPLPSAVTSARNGPSSTPPGPPPRPPSGTPSQQQVVPCTDPRRATVLCHIQMGLRTPYPTCRNQALGQENLQFLAKHHLRDLRSFPMLTYLISLRPPTMTILQRILVGTYLIICLATIHLKRMEHPKPMT
ncbi:hypothetical protein EDC04DRAFT_305920 [Pisolithus marmoratus]|nr:hypothetical protein EDC04DRAFT_305920 [Pisolithus marmoratus]